MVNEQPRLRVGFVGLGLIGGSLALALREADFAAEVLAWDQDPAVLEQGLSLRVIDRAVESIDVLMRHVDIAVLATPTLVSERLLLQMLREPGTARCITDVASVKGSLCRAAAALPPAQAARYVPGHPIAGSERSGVAAARPELFQHHRVILTPDEGTDADALDLATRLWEASGATVECMSVDEHDAVLAATSHLPHVLAYALVDALAQSPIRDNIFRFAAGGFRDFTRIASSDPVMWRDIALTNRDALLAAIDDFSGHLATLRVAVAAGDSDALESTFRNAKQARDEFARDLEQRGRDGREH
jgi:3-phosphoshikimate 1-carboxyvinyltransferase